MNTRADGSCLATVASKWSQEASAGSDGLFPLVFQISNIAKSQIRITLAKSTNPLQRERLKTLHGSSRLV